jgi:hypothetical protein
MGYKDSFIIEMIKEGCNPLNFKKKRVKEEECMYLTVL